VSEQLQTVNI